MSKHGDEIDTDRRAMRYFGPSFSNSAMTQSVTHGMPNLGRVRLHSTRAKVGQTFRIEAIHHATNQLQLVLETKVDKVGVDEDPIRWSECGIVGQEER